MKTASPYKCEYSVIVSFFGSRAEYTTAPFALPNESSEKSHRWRKEVSKHGGILPFRLQQTAQQ